MGLDIYNIQRNLKSATKKVEEANISRKNKGLISKFHKYCIISNISQKRVIAYLYSLRIIAKAIKKDFDKANAEDIKTFVQKLQENNYSPYTRNNYKAVLKRFYKWLKGKDKRYPKEVEWIKTSIKRNERRLPGEGDLITEEEIKKLIQDAEHPRNKAFVSVLYESGCRINELCSLRIKDIKFDEYGAKINVSGKTGSRTIRLISSVPFLSSWVNNHPFNKDRESFLWVCVGPKNHNKPLVYQGIRNILAKVFKKSGINKRFNPHLFRHSRATFLANHLTEFQMNQYFGWVQGSGMPSTYVHLSGKNVDGAILELNGVKINKDEKKESELKPKKCPRCDMVNGFSDKYCSKCACILDIETAMEIDEERKVGDELISDLMKDKHFWVAFINKMKEMGIGGDVLRH